MAAFETFRNSDDRSLVSHATHQLNVNVCLCVRRESRTFIDVRALSSRPVDAHRYRGNKITEERLRDASTRCFARSLSRAAPLELLFEHAVLTRFAKKKIKKIRSSK